MYRLSLVFSCVVIGLTTTSAIATLTGCGRPTASYVCNPDQVLTTAQANLLDKTIDDIYKSTTCPCSTAQCAIDSSGYPIGIAVTNSLQLDSQNVGANSVAILDAALSSAKSFASSLLTSWNLGRCNEGIVIFYSQQYRVYYTAVDQTASLKLTPDIVGEITANARMAFGVNVSQGLTKLLQDYRAVLLGSYNRTTSWQSSGNEPRVAGVISAGCRQIDFLPSLQLLFSFSVLVISVLQISHCVHVSWVASPSSK